MTLNQDTSLDPGQSDDDDDLSPSSLLDLIGFNAGNIGDALANLDEIPEPSFDDLAELDGVGLDDGDDEEFDIEDEPSLEALTELEALDDDLDEPEIISFEGLDDDQLDDDELEDDDFDDDFDDDDEVKKSYIDMDLDDDELEDEGYEDDDDDFDDDDDESDYHDLYGDDDGVMSAFQDDDDNIDAYYDDLR